MSLLLIAVLFVVAALLIFVSLLPSTPSMHFTPRTKRRDLTERFARRLRLAGIYHQAPSFIVGAVAAFSIIVAIVCFALVKHPAGLLIGVLGGPGAFYMLMVRRERTFMRRAMRELTPFLNRFESAVRAGTPPATAYLGAVEHADVLRLILGDSAARMAAGGEFVEVLGTTVDVFPLRFWRIFVAQVQTNDATGGDLAEALSTTVTEINENISINAEAAADSAADRFQQLLITFIVIGGLFLFTLVLGREMMSALWTTVPGAIGGLVGIVMMFCGTWYSLRILRIIERRTLGEE